MSQSSKRYGCVELIAYS